MKTLLKKTKHLVLVTALIAILAVITVSTATSLVTFAVFNN